MWKSLPPAGPEKETAVNCRDEFRFFVEPLQAIMESHATLKAGKSVQSHSTQYTSRAAESFIKIDKNRLKVGLEHPEGSLCPLPGDLHPWGGCRQTS